MKSLIQISNGSLSGTGWTVRNNRFFVIYRDFFSPLGRENIQNQPCIRIFLSFSIVGITSLDNTPIRLTGFHLWSSSVGYWAKIAFLYFCVCVPEFDMLNIVVKSHDLSCKLNPNVSVMDITHNYRSLLTSNFYMR